MDNRQQLDDKQRDAQLPQTTITTPVSAQPANQRKRYLVLAFAVCAAALLTSGIWYTVHQRASTLMPVTDESAATETQTPSKTATTISPSHSPDKTKLPLGDNKYVSTGPKQGYVYSCQTSFNGGGAFRQGPWINTSAQTWDLTQKISVDGNVSWPQATWTAGVGAQTRTLTSKDLPKGHPTGTFPVSMHDDAYSYDRNPNSIKEQGVNLSIPLNPTVQAKPSCIGGEVGIATTGVLIFNAFDAGGRDAVATEIQDNCEGHPQEGGYYHYHGYSECFADGSGQDEHSGLLGYAFDGFGIYGLRGEDGKELSSADLDECHGHTHAIIWDGKQTTMYHYHFTHDFPYTVSCFRGTASVKAVSHSGSSQTTPTGTSGPSAPTPVKPTQPMVPPPRYVQ